MKCGSTAKRVAHNATQLQLCRAIKGAQIIALMSSRNAFASDHVMREVYVAGDYKKPFIVFQLDQAEFPDEVLYFISGFPRVSVGALDQGRTPKQKFLGF